MACRHKPDDPNCGGYEGRVKEARALLDGTSSEFDEARAFVAKDNARKGLPPDLPATPDASSFFVEEAEQVGPHLVMKVKYPSCAKCSYEGTKVLVYLHIGVGLAIKWRTIDPHFSDTAKAIPIHTAPSPSARFPASEDGWAQALRFADMMIPPNTR